MQTFSWQNLSRDSLQFFKRLWKPCQKPLQVCNNCYMNLWTGSLEVRSWKHLITVGPGGFCRVEFYSHITFMWASSCWGKKFLKLISWEYIVFYLEELEFEILFLILQGSGGTFVTSKGAELYLNIFGNKFCSSGLIF